MARNYELTVADKIVLIGRLVLLVAIIVCNAYVTPSYTVFAGYIVLVVGLYISLLYKIQNKTKPQLRDNPKSMIITAFIFLYFIISYYIRLMDALSA